LSLPLSGDLQVILLIVGTPADSQGFAVEVDGTAHPVSPADTLSVPDLSAGSHAVALHSFPSGCAVEGENARMVSVDPNSTTRLFFQLSCSPPLAGGDLRVTITTFGSGADPDGYALFLDESPSQRVSSNGEVTLPALAAGPHVVRLAGLEVACEVRNQNPQTVDVPLTTDVRFEVTCVPPVSGVIAYASRYDPDSFPNDLFVRSADGTTVRNLTNTPLVDERELAWSPDGLAMAMVTFSRESLFVSGADGSDRHLLADGLSGVSALRWVGDGRRLAFIDEGASSGTRVSAYDFATQQVGVLAVGTETAGVSGFCLPVDGSRVAYSTDDFSSDPSTSSILTVPADGGTPSVLTSVVGMQLTVEDCSPDGSSVAYTQRRPDDRSDIYLVPSDGASPPVNLTNEPALYRDVVWSPDGGLLAFAASPGSDVFGGRVYDLFTITPSGVRRRLSQESGSYHGLQWSPDGSRLLYVDGLQVYFINFDGTGRRTVTDDQLGNDGAKWQP
jgi:Tol biopolymer transport system component